MRRILLLSSLIFFLQGCFFGILHRPTTLGKGKWDASFYGAIQFLPNPDIREEVEKAGYTTTINTGMDIMLGATDRVDVGFHWAADGLGPFVRLGLLRFYRGRSVSELVFAPYILYEPFISKSVAGRFDLVYGWKLNPYFEPYVFYQGYYNPYFEKYFEQMAGYKPIGNVGGGYYHFYGIGSAMNIYFNRRSMRKHVPDLTFNMELSFTGLNLSGRIIPVFHFGIGISGASAFRILFFNPDDRHSRGGLFFNLLKLFLVAGQMKTSPPPPGNTDEGQAPSSTQSGEKSKQDSTTTKKKIEARETK